MLDIKKSLDKLFSLHTFGIKLGLDNIFAFLDYIGNPHQNLKYIHIAGTNGKGSTASFIASILQEHNYKTGLYTSPHFVRFNERIKINGIEISDEYTAKFLDKYFDYIDEHGITFFEATTALAFKYFNDSKVDYVVLETGLGGRLDATNVVNPLISIITSISLEHTNLLGSTIEEITGEKAGIIKEGKPAIIGLLPETGVKVVSDKCAEVHSELFEVRNYLDYDRGVFEFNNFSLNFDKFNLPLKGKYQLSNSSLAILAIFNILQNPDFEKIYSGLKNVIQNTNFSGRFEYFQKAPDIIFDSAHNPEGIQNFTKEFQKDITKYKKRYLIFSALKDKSIKEMLEMLKPLFDKTFLTQINIDRACPLNELEGLAKEINLQYEVILDPVKMINEFKNNDRENCLVVIGSMYLLGSIKTGLYNNIA